MAEEQKNNKSPHVLLLPFPGQGHMNPMIEFGKRLLSKGVKTTLVTTLYVSKTVLSQNKTSIDIKPISDGFDEGGYASADSSEAYLDTFQKVGSKSLSDLITTLISQGNPVDAVIYDSVVPWAIDVAMEAGIDAGAFFTQACAVNAIYYHVHKGFISVPISDAVSVPGLPRFEYWETPSFVHNQGPYPGWSKVFIDEQFSNIDKARWVISNTFYKLEEGVIEWMKKIWPLKVIGPTLPSMYLDRRLEDDKDYGMNIIKANHSEYMTWLNDKPKHSVVYVSFGSFAQLGPEQIEEVAWGLTDSGLNFLWVVRADEEANLPKGFLDVKTEKGLIVGWCKQLEVLAHESVGCFVTHCGFNSTLETISLGVPVLAMPQWTDQTTNAKCLEDIWGIGVRVKADEKGVVRRGNLLSCMKDVMEGERGVVARKKAEEWRNLAREAVGEGGSSDKDVNEFVSELKHKR